MNECNVQIPRPMPLERDPSGMNRVGVPKQLGE
jgi:hypothetical protein